MSRKSPGSVTSLKCCGLCGAMSTVVDSLSGLSDNYRRHLKFNQWKGAMAADLFTLHTAGRSVALRRLPNCVSA